MIKVIYLQRLPLKDGRCVIIDELISFSPIQSHRDVIFLHFPVNLMRISLQESAFPAPMKGKKKEENYIGTYIDTYII